MSYVERVIEQVKAKNAEQPEFIQAVTEVLTSLEPVIEAHPEYEAAGLLDRAELRAPRVVGRQPHQIVFIAQEGISHDFGQAGFGQRVADLTTGSQRCRVANFGGADRHHGTSEVGTHG